MYYECKIASYEDVLNKEESIIADGVKSGDVIQYYGYLDGNIISEGRAYILLPGKISPDYETLNETTACLSEFKTKAKQ